MMDMENLVCALEKYEKAKAELYKFYEPLKIEQTDTKVILKCPKCGIIFFQGNPFADISFSRPIICCGKIRWYD
jgi:hypothetical protein